jgi:hypothetical protein
VLELELALESHCSVSLLKELLELYTVAIAHFESIGDPVFLQY